VSFLALIGQASMQTRPSGIPQAVPATGCACELQATDGSRFTVAGTTPTFPRGWDPNRAKFVEVQTSHAEAFTKKVGIDPGEAGDWFRDFQVSSGYPGVPQYTLQLKLRKEGGSVAYVTRFLSDGRQVPFDYYAAGLCKADFAPAAVAERG